MPYLEELHLSNNALPNPNGDFGHDNLRRLFLTCNEIDSFEAVYKNLARKCPALETLSLAECPLTSVPRVQTDDKVIFINIRLMAVPFYLKLKIDNKANF